jgi:hypothetical protein
VVDVCSDDTILRFGSSRERVRSGVAHRDGLHRHACLIEERDAPGLPDIILEHAAGVRVPPVATVGVNIAMRTGTRKTSCSARAGLRPRRSTGDSL